MQRNHSAQDEQNDSGIGELLREAGRRDIPEAAIQDAVRKAVHAEWRDMVDQRKRRSRVTLWSMAAGVAIVALSALLIARYSATPTPPVAVASIVQVRSEGQGVAQVQSADGNWRDVRAGDSLPSGSILRTDAATRLALNFGAGLSVRIDGATQAQLSAARVSLEHGRLYVDAPADRHVPLTVQTPLGEIAHVGTQYQVRLDTPASGPAMSVGVREGRIALKLERQALQLDQGQLLAVDASGQTQITELTAYDESWRWAEQIAPPFEIENRSLADFLDWVARESGRTVRYVTPEARSEAARLVLRGSTEGLAPDRALAAVIATTRFAVHVEPDSIEIQLTQ